MHADDILSKLKEELEIFIKEYSEFNQKEPEKSTMLLFLREIVNTEFKKECSLLRQLKKKEKTRNDLINY